MRFLFSDPMLRHLASAVGKLSVSPWTGLARAEIIPRQQLHTSTPAGFHVTPPSQGAPAKKKRRSDPGHEKAKDDRRKRRLAKVMLKYEKNGLMDPIFMETYIS